jgi:hypothetical protein
MNFGLHEVFAPRRVFDLDIFVRSRSFCALKRRLRSDFCILFDSDTSLSRVLKNRCRVCATVWPTHNGPKWDG